VFVLNRVPLLVGSTFVIRDAAIDDSQMIMLYEARPIPGEKTSPRGIIIGGRIIELGDDCKKRKYHFSDKVEKEYRLF